jgi:hypothetical protein
LPHRGEWTTRWNIAAAKGVSVAQIAIAWVAAQGEDIVPLVGSRQRDQLSEALGALAVRLTAADLAAIARAVPKGAAAGDRYIAEAMKTLDSEKGLTHQRASALRPVSALCSACAADQYPQRRRTGPPQAGE